MKITLNERYIYIIMDNLQQFNREVLTKSILTQKWPNPTSSVFYVSLYKESETGLLFNERMLVLEERKYSIFYTKYFRPIALLLELEKKGVIAIKERLSILGTSVSRSQNLMTLCFVNDNNGKKSWIFKFISSELAEKWVQLYLQLQKDCMGKSYKTKQTISTGVVSDYHSILSKMKYFDHNGQILPKEEQEDKKKVNIKKMDAQD